jgi:ketosteroid isomerase-like protein
MAADDLLDELSCIRVIHRYATAVDAVDLATLRTCFFDDVQSSYVGQPFTTGVEPIVEMIERLERLKGTIHNLGPVSAVVDGTSAHATAGCLVLAVSAGDEPHGVTRGVKYVFDLESRNGEWRIVRLEHRVMWATAAPQSGLMGEPRS